MKLKGIDVSHHQGEINWKQVKAAGVQFAFIRCGYCNSDGSIELDKQFHANMKAANSVGLPVGVYVYSYATKASAAAKCAAEVLKLVAPYSVQYPLVFDIEDKKYKYRSKAENTAIAEAALKVWEAAGYYAMLYTYKAFADDFLDMAALKQYDLWIAHYTDRCGYKGAHGIWQYTDSGKVAGISGNVDMNYSNYNYAAIIKKAKLNSPGYRVRVKATALNVRSGAGTNYKAVKQLPKGTVCCIVQEKSNGGTRWGKLADGTGWISLKHTENV